MLDQTKCLSILVFSCGQIGHLGKTKSTLSISPSHVSSSSIQSLADQWGSDLCVISMYLITLRRDAFHSLDRDCLSSWTYMSKFSCYLQSYRKEFKSLTNFLWRTTLLCFQSSFGALQFLMLKKWRLTQPLLTLSKLLQVSRPPTTPSLSLYQFSVICLHRNYFITFFILFQACYTVLAMGNQNQRLM